MRTPPVSSTIRGNHIILWCLLLLTFLFPVSCSTGAGETSGENIMRHSKLLSLYDRTGYTEAVIYNPKGEEVAHYILVGHNDSMPSNLPLNAEIIRIPIQNSVLDSEVYAGVLEELDSQNAIKGMFDAGFVTSPELKGRIERGEISNLGSPALPDTEKITALQPDAIFISYFEGMQTQSLEKGGAPIIKMYDLQESEPLARAEWIKFIGRLAGKGEEADRIFRKVAEDYDAVKVANAERPESNRQKVLTEIMYEGMWNVAGGNSYQAALIKDAGGRYFKENDDSKTTLMLIPEQVLKEGHDADVWLIRYYGNGEELKNILLSDPVYSEIKAFKDKNIYFSDTSVSGLFREFPFHPERILNDYSIILSRGTDDSLKYFKKLPM